ncbi:MAG: BatD family protein [Flavobacteriaceae bacterium]|nr:BatD family protein [Flavobacteriaceae bacterium]
MVSKFGKIVLVVFICSFHSYGQQLISYVSLNHETAYIGQPVQLTVSVYTNTWFTTGIDVGNIQVEGALTVYFRSVSNTREFSGKKFAGVDFIYNLFPTKSGEIFVPELKINVESPKPGGYKGIKHVVNTKVKTLNVNDVPTGYDPNNWLVSSSLNITEQWNTTLNTVKVGDVLQRSITRSAGGTLSEFIPAQQWDSVIGVSIYNTRPKVNTFKSKTAVSAKRTETVNYLFEKEGEIVLPQIEFIYWNYNNKRFFKKVIDSTVITVAPNADLEMLASIKKRLEKENQETELVKDQPLLILGMTPKRFVIWVVLGVLGIFILFKILKWMYFFCVKKYSTYINSEYYQFKKVLQAIKQDNNKVFIEQLTLWMLRLELSEQSFDFFLKTYGTENLKREYNRCIELMFKSESGDRFENSKVLMDALKISRKSYYHNIQNKAIEVLKTDWLNPTN